MMARLIDADKLLTQVRQIDFLKMPNSTKLCASEIMMMINRQPTAYDVEKVVEELKEWSFEAEIVIPGSDGYDDTANREIICTGNAIDIVRKGGVE